MTMYNDSFFSRRRGFAGDSARAMAPLIMDLLRPKSIVDVGCGDGIWLAAFAAQGVDDYLGIDGEYARSQLQIPADHFEGHDLSAPLSIPRTFDLAMSLEVTEHLPESAAHQFITSLTTLSPVVLFSAAIPRQGGTGHVNEQPPAYWARLFAREGYRSCDCLRQRLWNNSSVACWYAQNTILYATPAWFDSHPALQPFLVDEPLHLVHPRLFEWRDDRCRASENPGVKAAAGQLKDAVRRKLERLSPVAPGESQTHPPS
ncbi:MAG TPA: methyltransferase domain-containing protein [Tepidisphaeraceae bacterium]|nr:methyltransferase domain-containing protein [Tepidisphaeraceae bacterium]